MSYIITAEVCLGIDENLGGDAEKVKATVLNNRDGVLTFCVPGAFGEECQRTLDLCKMLIEAGFVSFGIGHSF